MPAGAFMLTSFSIPTITGITPVGPYELEPLQAAARAAHRPAADVTLLLFCKGVDWPLFERQCTCLAGGNEALKKQFNCTIVGPKADEGRIPGINIALKASSTVVRLLVALRHSTLCWMHRLGGSPGHIRCPHWPCIPYVLSSPAQQQRHSACIWTCAGASPNSFLLQPSQRQTMVIHRMWLWTSQDLLCPACRTLLVLA